MSLEVAIQENTAAVKELIGVWSRLLAQGKVVNQAVENGATVVHAGTALVDVSESEAAQAKKSEKPAPIPAAPATATPTPSEAAPAATATESPSELTYEQVSAAINAKVKVSREAVVAALAKFGAKKGTELKKEQWANFIKELA